ncbi:MAG: hypothetical protein JWR26_3089 [Pedosphaera sp.]|nr:hypothetical protein [Pedosphaera sp.]
MKKILMVMVMIALAGAALSAVAGLSSGSVGSLMVVAAVESPRRVAVVLTVPADYVTVPLAISSDQKNAAQAYEETHEAMEMIFKKVKENGQFRAMTGLVTLAERKDSYGISSGGWHQSAAVANIYLLVPLTKERDNLFVAGVEAAKFVEALHLPGKTKCEMGRMLLAVENPERHRAELQIKIKEEINQAWHAMGPVAGSAKVDGLESSVMVRQADDRNVELWLNYSLSLSLTTPP